jgi:CheY-like chemotaxis protein
VSLFRHGPPVSCLHGMNCSAFDLGAHQGSSGTRLGALLPLARGLTVLVVDDDEFVRDSTRLLLEEAGACVLTARDGAAALDQLATHTPDLILSDLDMPRLDGYQLVERVRSDPARASLPIIAVSALASPADRARILRAGFDAQVGKPFDYADLAEAFKSAMRRLPSLYVRQRDRLRAFAEQVRLRARELRQASRFVLGRTRTLRGTGLPCRCGASAETLWRCADCARRCCPECAFRSDGAFTCPTCADRRLAA